MIRVRSPGAPYKGTVMGPSDNPPPTTPAPPDVDQVDAELVEDGKLIYAVMRLRGIEVRERVPVHVQKLSEEQQSDALDRVIKLLRERLRKALVKAGALEPPARPGTLVRRGKRYKQAHPPGPNWQRRLRNAEAKESQAEIRRKRLERMHERRKAKEDGAA